MIPATSRRAYHLSRFVIPAKSCMASRYARADVIATSRHRLAENPRLRAAISKLVASRFTSHSNGPGFVSSKSFMSNTSVRSGDANPPKLARWASPQSWTFSLVLGTDRQVGGHDRGRAPVERERRREHALVADVDQARRAGSPPAVEDADRVGAVGARGPRRVRGAGHLGAGGATVLDAGRRRRGGETTFGASLVGPGSAMRRLALVVGHGALRVTIRTTRRSTGRMLRRVGGRRSVAEPASGCSSQDSGTIPAAVLRPVGVNRARTRPPRSVAVLDVQVAGRSAPLGGSDHDRALRLHCSAARLRRPHREGWLRGDRAWAAGVQLRPGEHRVHAPPRRGVHLRTSTSASATSAR